MLLLIGFPREEIEKISEVDDRIVAVPEGLESMTLQEVIKSPPERYENILGNQRIVIMHDIPKEKISETMKKIRSLVGGHIIFATSTPTSLQWKLEDLIKELLEEDAYFRSRSR